MVVRSGLVRHGPHPHSRGRGRAFVSDLSFLPVLVAADVFRQTAWGREWRGSIAEEREEEEEEKEEEEEEEEEEGLLTNNE